MKTLQLIIIGLFTVFSVFSQDIKRLHVGDKVPNVVLKEMMNYKSGSANLDEFLDKPLIIDMWFAECGSCIDAIPFLDSLQKEYQGKLNIILSTFQPREKADKTFEVVRTLENVKFRQTVSDSVLLRLFPARIFPHQIWIDKNHRVVAITGGENTNRRNVEKFIKGEKVDFKEKIDVMDHEMVRGKEPLMNYLYGRDKDKILIYSYLSKFRPGFSSGASRDVDPLSKTIRYTIRNMWFAELYAAAYQGNSVAVDFNLHTDLIRDDTLGITTIPDFKNYSNLFCYDLIFQDSFKSRISKYMVAELDHIFNINSHREKRMINCYIVRPIGNKKRYLAPLYPEKQGEYKNEAMTVNHRIVLNKALPIFIKERFTAMADKPFYFEGLSKGRWNFSLVWNPNDIAGMSAELKKYDLEIVLEQRQRDVIVLEN